MAYSTIADVMFHAGGEQKLTQIADQDVDGKVDDDAVNRAIANADRYIDSYVAKKHRTPLTEPVPTIIREMSAQHAVYMLKSTRCGALTEQDKLLLEQRNMWLKGLEKGDVVIGTTPEPPPSPEHEVSRSTPRPNSKAVSRRNLEGFS